MTLQKILDIKFELNLNFDATQSKIHLRREFNSQSVDFSGTKNKEAKK